jgi:hypothetical protein
MGTGLIKMNPAKIRFQSHNPALDARKTGTGP